MPSVPHCSPYLRRAVRRCAGPGPCPAHSWPRRAHPAAPRPLPVRAGAATVPHPADDENRRGAGPRDSTSPARQRPVARHLYGHTLEVTRIATDRTRDACSKLYAAAWRATAALGYTRLVTYTQADETGASLHAAGWSVIGRRTPHAGWDRPSRPRHTLGSEHIPRTLWEAP
ncbi:XF1762 family protein (plasmid) [Kitasatospora sp. cg17-2]